MPNSFMNLRSCCQCYYIVQSKVYNLCDVTFPFVNNGEHDECRDDQTNFLTKSNALFLITGNHISQDSKFKANSGYFSLKLRSTKNI